MKKYLFIVLMMVCSHQIFAQDGIIGEIRLFAGNFAPRNWAFCNGQILSIAQNTALFSLLGTTYGGNGQTTFALPDLRGRVAVSSGQSTTGRSYTLGETGGTETNTLLVSQMPAHVHQVTVSQPVNSGDGNTDDPTGNYPAASKNGYSTSTNASGPAQTITVGIAGSSQPMNNVQPYLGLNYIICIYGVYPSRP